MTTNTDLKGKSVVITGATSGIGFEAAMQFAQQGSFVIGIGRSVKKNQDAVEKIRNAYPEGQIEYLLADLAQQKQVQAVSGVISSVLVEHGFSNLDVLINNAGVYLERKQMTEDGIEMTFAVNHLAPFLMTHELSPLLKCSKHPRVLTVSSYSHRNTPLSLNRIANPRPYVSLLAYKRSKLCNVLFSYELNRRSEAILALAVDPGLVNTAIAEKSGHGISAWVWRRRRLKGTSADLPVKTLLYLAGEHQVDTSQSCYYRDCQPITPSRIATSEELAGELWTLSSQLTGITSSIN